MAKNYSGRDYLFHVLDSSPSSPAISSEYTLLGLGQSLSISQSRNAMDKSNKADGDNSSFVAGRRNITVSSGGVFDHTEDAGYTILETVFASSDGIVWFLATPLNSGDKEFYGSGVITDLSVTLDDESVSNFTTTIQVTGALVTATDGGT